MHTSNSQAHDSQRLTCGVCRLASHRGRPGAEETPCRGSQHRTGVRIYVLDGLTEPGGGLMSGLCPGPRRQAEVHQLADPSHRSLVQQHIAETCRLAGLDSPALSANASSEPTPASRQASTLLSTPASAWHNSRPNRGRPRGRPLLSRARLLVFGASRGRGRLETI